VTHADFTLQFTRIHLGTKSQVLSCFRIFLWRDARTIAALMPLVCLYVRLHATLSYVGCVTPR